MRYGLGDRSSSGEAIITYGNRKPKRRFSLITDGFEQANTSKSCSAAVRNDGEPIVGSAEQLL